MTWHERTICRILLLITILLAHTNGSPELAASLRAISNEISVHAPKRERERDQ